MGDSPTADLTARTTPAEGRGVLLVEDYVGSAAGDAARAVRRAGLRPGLDREPGHPPERIGLVVAQQPRPGETQQRGGILTLYVGAPEPHSLRGRTQEPEVESAQAPERRAATPRTPPAPRRARKPRLASQPPPAEQVRACPPEQPPVEQPPAQEPRVRSPLAQDPAPLEQLAAEMGEIFTSPERRGGYPREPLALRAARAWRWARAHRLTALAVVLIPGWLGLALVEHHHGTPQARSSPRRAMRDRAAAPTPPAARIAARKRAPRRGTQRTARPPQHRREHAPALQHTRAPVASSEAASPVPPSPAPPSEPTQDPPQPPRASGGPFSP